MHSIERRRTELDFSVAEVAELCNISSSTIYRIEREAREQEKAGKKSVKYPKVKRATAEIIAAGLDCSFEELFKETEVSNRGRNPRTPTAFRASRRGVHGQWTTSVCPKCHLQHATTLVGAGCQ